jgi:formylglycine-generating enzyme required for sulfatase activity
MGLPRQKRIDLPTRDQPESLGHFLGASRYAHVKKNIMKTAVFAFSLVVASTSVVVSSSVQLETIEVVDIAPRAFAYRRAGDFSVAGQTTDAPLVTVARTSVLHIMKRQVKAAEYDRCVAEDRCMSHSSSESSGPNMPAVQVSWQDATAYATWLSTKTGETWRLPTDEEWVFAAGSRFHDDALSVTTSRDPSVRWLVRYEKESEQVALDQRPRPTGAFGANEYGLLDLSGNVWEWTNTCFMRQSLDAEGKPAGAWTANCGVRVVEGEHRTYVTDFVRDARGGGCAVGKPPSNLGFRLVREDDGIASIASTLRRLVPNH